MDKPKTNFISFQNSIEGKKIKVRMNLDSVAKYAKDDGEGNFVLDFYISKRKKPVKNKDGTMNYYIAYTFDDNDNTKLVENIFNDENNEKNGDTKKD